MLECKVIGVKKFENTDNNSIVLRLGIWRYSSEARIEETL